MVMHPEEAAILGNPGDGAPTVLSDELYITDDAALTHRSLCDFEFGVWVGPVIWEELHSSVLPQPTSDELASPP